MSDQYKHDGDGVAAVITDLKTKLDNYKDVIMQLNSLIDTINGSGAWKDNSVKTSFISTCNSYLSIYKNLSTAMENYINYLSRKSDAADALERAFAG